jgi:hypothetical protein
MLGYLEAAPGVFILGTIGLIASSDRALTSIPSILSFVALFKDLSCITVDVI